MMKRTLLFLAAFLSVCICYGQNRHSERIVKRLENKLYVVENDIKYKVDETRVIAKLKPQRELPNTLCEKSQELGFGILEIPVPEGMKVEDYVSLIERTDDFEYVDYNTYGKFFFTPNDSLIGNGAGHQWYLDNINAYSAWNITKGKSSIKVAVLDSGVDSCHYDLHYGSDSYTHLDIPDGYNYPHSTNYSAPLNKHGTMIAGIIGAKTNNNRGIAGISGGNHSAGITIIPYTIGDDEPSENYVISAISNAVGKGAKIINMSYGFPFNYGVNDAINAAYNQGITIVCAAGNTYNDFILFPASHQYTIAVGATDQSNQRLDLSNYGDDLDLVAPGIDIKSTSLNNSYNSNCGTSYAAPQVAGVAALMLSVNPNLTPSQIRSTLQSTCTKPSGYSYTNGWNEEVGYGLLNAYAAVFATVYDAVNAPNAADTIMGPRLISTYGQYQINNLPSGVTVTWSLSDSNYNNYTHLISNSPALGYCLIFRDEDVDMMNATLTAVIKCNNVPIDTLKKTGLYAYEGFKGHYTSGNLSGDISYTMIVHVKSNTNTVITSPNLFGATVSYSPTATIPTYWNFNPNSGQLVVNVPYNGTIPAVININDGCGNQYTLYLYAQSSKGINVSYGDDSIIVTVNEDDGSDSGMDFSQPWTVEVRSATTGALMATQSATSRSSTISTAGWPKGIYIVKVTIGKEVMTEKVIVK